MRYTKIMKSSSLLSVNILYTHRKGIRSRKRKPRAYGKNSKAVLIATSTIG